MVDQPVDGQFKGSCLGEMIFRKAPEEEGQPLQKSDGGVCNQAEPSRQGTEIHLNQQRKQPFTPVALKSIAQVVTKQRPELFYVHSSPISCLSEWRINITPAASRITASPITQGGFAAKSWLGRRNPAGHIERYPVDAPTQ